MFKFFVKIIKMMTCRDESQFQISNRLIDINNDNNVINNDNSDIKHEIIIPLN